MKNVERSTTNRPKLILLSVLATLGTTVQADEAEIASLTSPDSSVSIGLGNTSGESKDRAIFGQFNGMRKDNNSLLLDFSIIKRDDATGLWTNAGGRNLGLDNREFRFSQDKQGDWKYFLEYNEITRHDIRTINTGLQGAGTTTPIVNLLATQGSGVDFNPEIRRRNVSVGMEKWLGPNLQFEANFKNEGKEGSRLSGKGFACSAAWVTTGTCTSSTTQWVLLMLPEAINTSTKQFDAKLNFSGDKFLVSGGYYGSFFNNSSGVLTPTVPGTLNNPLGTPTALDTGLQSTMGLPVALPPDNQAHQIYVAGNYEFTPSTRATFKYSYSHATQNEEYSSMGLANLAPAGYGSLGGVVDTNLAQLGLTARPVSRLSLLANIRYEDKKDTTPVALYNVEGDTAVPANYFINGLTSAQKLAAKAEAGYQLPDKYHVTFGLDYNSIDRGYPDDRNKIAGLNVLRAQNEETGYRAELRRSMADSINASISYISSKRSGGDWYSLNTATYGQHLSTDQVLALSATTVFPMSMADRERDKVRVSMNWDPLDTLTLQFVVEDGKDKYTTGSVRGLQDNKTGLYSIDAAYTLSEDWKLNGYWSEGNQTLDVNHSTGYVAALENISTTFGLGLAGKAGTKLDLGADVYFLNDKNRYGIEAAPGANANNIAQVAAYDIPDVTYHQVTLKLFGKYALKKNADVRVNYIRQLTRLDEWTWGYNGTSFTYSDNTTVTSLQDQDVSFIGIFYIYKMK